MRASGDEAGPGAAPRRSLTTVGVPLPPSLPAGLRSRHHAKPKPLRVNNRQPTLLAWEPNRAT